MTLATAAPPASVTGIKRGLKALLLGTAFAQASAALAAEIADGLVLPPLRGVDRAEKKILGELPRAELFAVRSLPMDDSGYSQAYDHVIAVRFYMGGDDEELITDQVERYLLAARRLFTLEPGDEHKLFPFIGGSTIPGPEDYDPIVRLKEAESTLVKAGTLELVVKSLQG